MRNFKPDISELSEYKSWNEQNQTSLSTYAEINMTSPDLLIATISLFYPSFVEFDNCVIVEWKFDERIFNEWKQALHEDMRGVEFKMNYRLVSDFFC